MKDVVMSDYARTQYHAKYAHTVNGRKETWPETAERVITNVLGPHFPHLVKRGTRMVAERKFIPAGRQLNAAGRRDQYLPNCYLLKAEDSREGWADVMHWATQCLMVGGGVGVVYSPLRGEGCAVTGLGGASTGPLALMKMVNEVGRYIMQGGSRRSAIWAGLHWDHPDVFKFIRMKDHPLPWKQLKNGDFSFPLPMEGTNVSVILDDAFFAAYDDPTDPQHDHAHAVYWECIRRMRTDGEPGFSIDVGGNAGEHLRNACTEISSADNLDMCNLASFNLAGYSSLEEFHDDLYVGVAYMIAASLVSKLPIQAMYKVRDKNRRIGVGLMGLHEWLLKRGKSYGPDRELGAWLAAYATTGSIADDICDRMGISRSVKTRSVAPTGTISIVAETTSGCEPIIHVASKRRYVKGNDVVAQYIVDPTAHRLVQQGVRPDDIEDSVTLSRDVDRRIAFQAWLQKYVDHGISSTINLPRRGSLDNHPSKDREFGDTLMRHLPQLRGVTVFPDGSRGGQPFTRVPYEEAMSKLGVEFVDNSETNCASGFCNS